LSSGEPDGGRNGFEPIYKTFYDQGLTESIGFSLCLGKNGGYVQIGGTDEQGALDGL
jgi:hypothetical protein